MNGCALVILGSCFVHALAIFDTSVVFNGSLPTSTACDAALQALALGLPQGLCRGDGDMCNESCSPAFESLLDACMGDNVTLPGTMGETVVPFDPLKFALAFSAVLQGSCAEIPVDVTLSQPTLTLTCGGVISLLTSSTPYCGGSNQTECSQVCQYIVRAPYTKCSPEQEVATLFNVNLTAAQAVGLAFPLLSPQCVGTLNGTHWPDDGPVPVTPVPASPCDAAATELFMLNVDGEVNVFEACHSDGDVCHDTCADIFHALFDACVGENWTVGPLGINDLFDPAHFVFSAFSYGLLRRDPCASVPLTVAFEYPNLTFGCEDAVYFLDFASVLDCNVPNQTTCSPQCHRMIATPFHSCMPLMEIPLFNGFPGAAVTVASKVHDLRSQLSPGCQEVFEEQLWSNLPDSPCDAAVILFQVSLQGGACSAEGETCNEECAPAFQALFEVCMGENVTTGGPGGRGGPGSPPGGLHAGTQPFDVLAFAVLQLGFPGLPSGCGGVPVAAALSLPGVSITCEDSVFALNAASFVCSSAGGPTCPLACQSVLSLPFRVCTSDQEVLVRYPGGFSAGSAAAQEQVSLVRSSQSLACQGFLDEQQWQVAIGTSSGMAAGTTAGASWTTTAGTAEETTEEAMEDPPEETTHEVGEPLRTTTGGVSTVQVTTIAGGSITMVSSSTEMLTTKGADEPSDANFAASSFEMATFSLLLCVIASFV